MENIIVYQITPADLRSFLADEIAKEAAKEKDGLLNKMETTFVGVNEVSVIHRVSRATVLNYVKDGLIEPEVRTVENGRYHFRLSYVMSLDFSKLKKELMDRRKAAYSTGRIIKSNKNYKSTI